MCALPCHRCGTMARHTSRIAVTPEFPVSYVPPRELLVACQPTKGCSPPPAAHPGRSGGLFRWGLDAPRASIRNIPPGTKPDCASVLRSGRCDRVARQQPGARDTWAYVRIPCRSTDNRTARTVEACHRMPPCAVGTASSLRRVAMARRVQPLRRSVTTCSTT
jgi:hypothetical protein